MKVMRVVSIKAKNPKPMADHMPDEGSFCPRSLWITKYIKNIVMANCRAITNNSLSIIYILVASALSVKGGMNIGIMSIVVICKM